VARVGHQARPTDAGVVLHGGIVRISSSRQQRALLCTPSGNQQGQAVLIELHPGWLPTRLTVATIDNL